MILKDLVKKKVLKVVVYAIVGGSLLFGIVNVDDLTTLLNFIK